MIDCLSPDSHSTCATAAVGLLAYYYSTATYGKWTIANVPHTKPVPLFGHSFGTMMGLESENETFDKIYRQFPDERLCGFYQMKTPCLMIRDPELVNDMLVKGFSHFTDHGPEMDPSVNFLASSLFFARGRKWKIMRQKLSPAFTSGKLKLMHGQIVTFVP